MITHTELLERLHYNECTGVFTWINPGQYRTQHIGSKAGSVANTGYRTISINRKAYLAHRLAWFYIYGEWPNIEVDHIDRNRDNNSLSNLRLATKSENRHNRVKAHTVNKTGLIGAVYRKNRGYFEAKIKVNNKRVHLGTFSSAHDAHKAYLKAKLELHPTWNQVC